MGPVEEEIDETIYWLELLIEIGILSPDKTEEILKEANELLALSLHPLRPRKRIDKH